MNRLLAIDPGNSTGFAMFVRFPEGWRLTQAHVCSPGDVDGYRHAPDITVIEVPARTFAGKPEKSILKLAMTAGRYIERFRCSPQHLIEPRQWKGTVNGDVMTARITAALTPAEREIAALSRFDHNMLDAIGIGKWAIRQPWVRALG